MCLKRDINLRFSPNSKHIHEGRCSFPTIFESSHSDRFQNHFDSKITMNAADEFNDTKQNI